MTINMKTTVRFRCAFLLCGMPLVASLVSASVGFASPLTLVVDTSQSNVDVTFKVITYLEPSGTADISGAIAAELQIAEAGAGSSHFGSWGADLQFSDMFMTDSFLSNTLDITTEGVAATLVGGLAPGTSGPTNYTFDLAGFSIWLNQGTITLDAEGVSLGTWSDVIDLSETPLEVELTSSIASVTATDLGCGLFDIELTFPVDETGLLPAWWTGLPVDAEFTLDGQITSNGVLYVPEPAKTMLLCFGCLGLGGLGLLRRLHS